MSDSIAQIPQLDSFPRAVLGHTPTPVDSAPALGREMGITLYVKRDDCTGLAFGGNKVRQLEFYMGEAREREADVVLITGAVQSNFVRTTAAAARYLGMDVHIQLEERVSGADEIYQNSGNVLLDRLLGAHLHSFSVGEDESAADRNLEAIADELAAAGQRPYVIHLGVEHPPIGGLGYVRAAAELVAQQRELDLQLDAVVVASGSGLTHAGLLVGLRALGQSVPVYGVCVRREVALQKPRVLRRAREISALISQPELITEEDVRVTDISFAPGYGKLNPETLQAIADAGRLEGLLLDPVYTGKTMAGLRALAEAGEFGGERRVLFMHTGGQPAIFGYQRALERFFDESPRAGVPEPRASSLSR
jgi:D-cysteine desulfhydrase/L-cysteate sulfo-lyase